jgi:hypothetical protein
VSEIVHANHALTANSAIFTIGGTDVVLAVDCVGALVVVVVVVDDAGTCDAVTAGVNVGVGGVTLTLAAGLLRMSSKLPKSSSLSSRLAACA